MRNEWNDRFKVGKRSAAEAGARTSLAHSTEQGGPGKLDSFVPNAAVVSGVGSLSKQHRHAIQPDPRLSGKEFRGIDVPGKNGLVVK